jgi:RimJ/RimL family protein N-acetyltransferase
MLLAESGQTPHPSCPEDDGCTAGGRARSLFYDVSIDEDEELEKYLAYIHTVYPVFGFGLCTVQRRETGEVIGWCGLQPIGDDDSPLGRIELGYLIDRDFRGQGYGYEACRAILDFAFDRLELDEVYARIDGGNAPSVHLARRLGFAERSDGLWVVKRNLDGLRSNAALH